MLRHMQQDSLPKSRKRRHYIPEWAELRGYTPAQLASGTGADKSLVSRWLNHGVVPSEDYLEDISVMLDTSRDALFYPPPREELTYTDEDPSLPPTMDPDRPMTAGEHTGFVNMPGDASPQIDVTAGMGAGGLTIVADGVPGRAGMTFSAEHVSDYWRIPGPILTSMGGVKPTDVAFIPVQGDSMLPTLLEGDVVVVDTRHRWPSPDGIYALTDAFGGIIVKRLEMTSRPGEEEKLVNVISDNPRHPVRTWRLDELRIVGRVVRKFGNVQ